MTTRAKVALLRTRPETVLEDYDRLFDLAGASQHLDPNTTTILKDNISWHFPFPAANTTPWQLEGTVRALTARGYTDQVCVQNKTVVTDAFKGEDLNGYVPIFNAYGIPVRYNFREDEMPWISYRPKARMLVLDRIFPEGIKIPEYFRGKNIVHLPTVKCVSGDTELMLADGSITTIRDLVAEQQARAPSVLLQPDGERRVAGRVELLSMSAVGEVRPCTATWFWRTLPAGRPVHRVQTRTGRTLTATADHLVHTPEGWVPLGELRVGSRLAIARRMRVDGVSQPLPHGAVTQPAAAIVGRAGRVYTAAFVQDVIDAYQEGGTATAIAERAGVRWQSVQAILKRHEVPIRRNVTQLRVPARTSQEFWRWMGYVMAEGCIERHASGSDKLWWVNAQPAIREEFIQLTRDLFGIEAKEHRNGKHIYIYSRNLGRFFEELGLPVPLNAGNKRVPDLLFRCPDDEIAAFLSAYLDGDGTVSRKQAELSVTTKSERLARDVQWLISRLGAAAFQRAVERTIPGKWAESRRYYLVSVSGDDLIRLAPYLTLRHPMKQALLDQQTHRFLAGRRSSNWDVVPLAPDHFRTVREGLGFTQASTGRPSSVNTIENGHGRPTPRIARYFVDLFERRDVDGAFAREIGEMRLLASEDLAWDEIESVERVMDDDVELYDITVPGAASFVGNGMILHNCHIYTTTTGAMKNAFGGLLNTRRHYTHSWIHETLVDLLAIQKEIHSGLFAVMDGTTAGNGPGPRTMFPVVKNVILASADQTAIDAVAAKLMGFDPLSIGYIRLAHEAGLGVGDPREIELAGDTDLGKESWGFKVGDNGASRVGDVVWFGPLKPIQNLFMRTPLVNLFILGSETYHDYYRWPMRDKKTFHAWRRATPWGRLFTRYRRQGALRRPLPAGQATAAGN